jgi:hypothetical protein
MRKSLFAALIVIIIALSITLGSFVFLYYQATTSQSKINKVNEIPLLYEGRLVTVRNSTGAYLDLKFQGNMTLFDCKATITYQAINGTQVVIIKDLGLVDTSDSSEFTGYQLSDYPTENRSVDIEFIQTNPPNTIQINAFGYTSPNAAK